MALSKEHFRELAASPEFISGIYNYCDRWCEHCAFTSRCLSYASMRDHEELRSGPDETMADAVMDVFRVTAEMIEDIAREQDIDLSDISDSELAPPPPSIAVGVAKGYVQAVQAWLSKHEIAVGAALMQEESSLRLVDSASEPTAKECIEICTRYSVVIVTKLARAFECAPTGVDTMDDKSDANGSAKVALIAMDHSLEAWNSLLRRAECPLARKRGRKLAVALERLRTRVEGALPGARAFARPGFDET